MSLSEKITPLLPMLRRYARALTGNQAEGDACVKATLEAIVAAPDVLQQGGDLRVQLYTLFQATWADETVSPPSSGEVLTEEKAIADSRLAKVMPLQRQALLLKTVEGFDTDQAAIIMGQTSQTVDSLVAKATKELALQLETNVLIIEDEPIIAMDLQTIVESMGHSVTQLTTTRDEAVKSAKAHPPGLVLADIQLAEGSSGIDAVKDILEMFDVPVIFITAFPERLLTGERPEPTFLLTKPFLSSAVQTAISQALFFSQSD